MAGMQTVCIRAKWLSASAVTMAVAATALAPAASADPLDGAYQATVTRPDGSTTQPIWSASSCGDNCRVVNGWRFTRSVDDESDPPVVGNWNTPSGLDGCPTTINAEATGGMAACGSMGLDMVSFTLTRVKV
ncbi:hypothetical protein [Mycolicibacterium brumae]|uniref:Secreted protein n=1 Tax=Mycolicibacterium brumae TaxID=85968 RepID=A0A2G5PCT7_9MYCO|nr:hypothetical protein [Mycolicibacterium brumae]MCV7193552.1 hypothetical protein [Mycolicibacterium brumae]PIB76128.1 hypothetical protein CQY22_007035 [Mycolicibacterium brumae]RWA17251.1 hypothetical protein MBRU_06415 [Mycolicibacterium brumae DSM 44177]UWW09176.1 hypothetical protein L2Z93_002262 [Mycolicibacterium brumae]